MATTPNQTHPSFEAPAKTQRRYTVGYVPNHGDTSTPALNLGGKWLREVGFDTGVGVTVKIVDGCIVLTLYELTTARVPTRASSGFRERGGSSTLFTSVVKYTRMPRDIQPISP